MALCLTTIGQPTLASAAPLKCMKPERVKLAPANVKYRDADQIQRISSGEMTESAIKEDLVRMNTTYFHADAKLPDFLKNIMAGYGFQNDGMYEKYLGLLSGGDIGSKALHYTTKPFTDRTAIADANTWLWTTNSPYYNFYDVSYVAWPSADGIPTMKCNDGGIALIGWYRHPTFGTGKVPSDLGPTLAALKTDPTTLAADRVYIASIIDLRQEHLPYLKKVRQEAFEYAAKWSASPDAGDRIDMYYHWPVGVDTVTLHMHVKVNSLWSPVERIKSYRMDDLIAYLDPTTKPAWASGTKYEKEAIVAAGGRYYRAIEVTGDQRSGGVMPTATTERVADGNVTWHYISDRLDVIDYVAHRIWTEGGIYMRGDDGKAALVPAPDHKVNTAYKIGDQVTSNNQTYRAKAITGDAKTAASTPPTATTAADIRDGNVTWSHIGPKRTWTEGKITNPYRTAHQRIKTIVESGDRSSYVIQFAGAKPEDDRDPPVIAVVDKASTLTLAGTTGSKMTNPTERTAVFRATDLERIIEETAGTDNAATGDTLLVDYLHCQFDLPPDLPMNPDCYKAMPH